jgi:hypothetical protein
VGCLTISSEEGWQGGILASGWPSWAFGAKARGWIIDIIIIKDIEILTILQKHFPASMILLYETGLTLADPFNKINIWFSDIDLPCSLAIWSSCAKVVISSRRVRHISDPLWKMEPRKFSHFKCGGVTDGKWTCYVYSKGARVVPHVEPTSYHDMSSILDSRTAGIPCPPPHISTSHDALPRVIQLRPNTYHGGGLMPWCARSCFVVTPCVYSPSGWVRRRCTQQELASIFDIPGVLKTSLSPNLIKTLINDTSILPSKIIASFLDLIPDHNQALEGFEREMSPALGIITPKGMNHHDDPFVVKGQDRELRNSKAAKNDDAPVPEYLWNEVAVPCSSSTKIGALPII